MTTTTFKFTRLRRAGFGCAGAVAAVLFANAAPAVAASEISAELSSDCVITVQIDAGAAIPADAQLTVLAASGYSYVGTGAAGTAVSWQLNIDDEDFTATLTHQGSILDTYVQSFRIWLCKDPGGASTSTTTPPTDPPAPETTHQPAPETTHPPAPETTDPAAPMSSPTAPPGHLPRTGRNTTLAAIGSVAFAIGGVLVLLGRRRRTSP